MVYRLFKVGLKARAAAWRYGRPSKKIKVVLVVGQDGAVGTAATLAALLQMAGEQVGVITRQFIEIAGERVMGSDQADVTGDPNRLQALLAQMRKAGCGYALLEVPPELPDYRFIGVVPHMLLIRRCGDNYIDQGSVTSAAARLTSLLAQQPAYIVYNRDDPIAEQLNWLHGQDGVISFGAHRRAECRMEQVSLHPQGSQVAVTIDHQTPLTLGTHQVGKQAVYNLAAAAAAAYILRLPVEAIEQGCLRAAPLAAHMQSIPVARPYGVMVDGAVTPAGIAESLEVAKHFSKNRLMVLYGAPLGLPATWLPRVGELIAAHADRILLTDGEYLAHQSPKQLREQVWQGVNAIGGDAKVDEIPDRQLAIEKAVGIARRGDIILVAGSTTRPYRQIGDEHLPWSDTARLKQLFEA